MGMHIGFDGKRAFQNKTGLGNYSRSLLSILATQHPEHQFTLMAPKVTGLFDTSPWPNIDTISPTQFPGTTFKNWWRRTGMVKDIQQSSFDIFHGLSNELPKGIRKAGKKTVVTVHDLIFERYPETYHWEERYVHRWKIKQACADADRVIAISEQTRNDLIDLYRIPSHKISTCYQNCHPGFERQRLPEEQQLVKQRYRLPETFILFVGSIAPRKNLITVCKALALMQRQFDIPLVVIGNGKKEKQEALAFMQQQGMANRLIFLNELPVAQEHDFVNGTDFPAIYQSATVLVYPSLFEGFGLPVLEALWSGLPVISSNASSMPEVAKDAALYFDPLDAEALAHQLQRLLNDADLRLDLIEKGKARAAWFSAERYAREMMTIYQELL